MNWIIWQGVCSLIPSYCWNKVRRRGSRDGVVTGRDYLVSHVGYSGFPLFPTTNISPTRPHKVTALKLLPCFFTFSFNLYYTRAKRLHRVFLVSPFFDRAKKWDEGKNCGACGPTTFKLEKKYWKKSVIDKVFILRIRSWQVHCLIAKLSCDILAKV